LQLNNNHKSPKFVRTHLLQVPVLTRFPQVFSEKDTQLDVFKRVEPIVSRVFEGQNVTIFAYGQTGSGKTHTINGTSDNPGLIPLTVDFLLAGMATNGSQISVSYLEIYNEKIYDLLDPSDKSISSYLDLRETSNKQIIVSGITIVPITTRDEFIANHRYNV
jgi:kinesin family protein 22